MRKTGNERIASRTPAQLEEGRRLERLFRERWKGTQRQFCQQHLNGKYAAGLNQIFNGYTLLTLDVAIVFARVLRCHLDDFSPRLARELRSVDIYARALKSGSPSEPAMPHNRPVHRWGAARMSKDGTWQWEPADSRPPVGRYAIQILGEALYPYLESGNRIVLDSSMECRPGDPVLVVLTTGLALIRRLVYERDGNVAVREIMNGGQQNWPMANIRFMHPIVLIDPRGILEHAP